MPAHDLDRTWVTTMGAARRKDATNWVIWVRVMRRRKGRRRPRIWEVRGRGRIKRNPSVEGGNEQSASESQQCACTGWIRRARKESISTAKKRY